MKSKVPSFIVGIEKKKEMSLGDGSVLSKVIDQPNGRNDPSPGKLLNGMLRGEAQ